MAVATHWLGSVKQNYDEVVEDTENYMSLLSRPFIMLVKFKVNQQPGNLLPCARIFCI